MLVIIGLLYLSLYVFTVSLVIFENNPPLTFMLTQFTPIDLLLGIVFGIVFTCVGIILYKYSELWKGNMLFLTESGLIKGSKVYLALTSAKAGIFEELPTRFLVLYICFNLDLLPLNLSWLLVCVVLVTNLIWTIFHLTNKKSSYKKEKYKTVKKSLPHLSTIFISGLAMYWLTLHTLSIYPAMISHFLLDFLMGLYVRRQKRMA